MSSRRSLPADARRAIKQLEAEERNARTPHEHTRAHREGRCVEHYPHTVDALDKVWADRRAGKEGAGIGKVCRVSRLGFAAAKALLDSDVRPAVRYGAVITSA